MPGRPLETFDVAIDVRPAILTLLQPERAQSRATSLYMPQLVRQVTDREEVAGAAARGPE